MAYILVVDDDADMLLSICQVLEDADYTVTGASNAQEALELIAQRRPDLAVLDIVMPEMDGVELCRRIRANPHMAKLPIIFLTAKGRPKDVVKGLDSGGDDYLTKPFEVIELPARVRAILRRASGGTLDPDAKHLVVGDLTLDTIRPDVQVGERQVRLTSGEHRLLHYLMQHAGQPVSTEQLLQDIWEFPSGVGDPQVVHVAVARLRAKIEPQSNDPQVIQNVRGRGYLIAG